MDRTSVTLKDPASGKEIIISSVGDTNANIIIPINKTNDEGVVQFEFIDQEEVSNIIANKFSPGCILPGPEITYPLNVGNGYIGGVTINPSYTLPNFPQGTLITTYYEISRSRDFNIVDFSKSYSNTTISNLLPEDMVNAGLGSSNEVNIGPNDYYYVRCKLFINSYTTEWSNIGSFKFDISTYLKPMNPEISEIIEANVLDLYSYVSHTSKISTFPNVRTGEIKFKVSPCKSGLGNPGTPDKILFKFKTDKTTSSPDDSNFKDEVEIELDNTNSEYYIIDLIPHVLYYGRKYKVSYKYINSNLGISSPYSEEVDVFQNPLDLEVLVSDMGIVTELSKISKQKTINLDDVFFSDRYVSKYINNNLWNNTILNDKTPNLKESFTISMVFEAKKEGNPDFTVITDRIEKTLKKNQNEYLGLMTYLTTDIDEGFRYDIKLKVSFQGVRPSVTHNKEFLVDQNIPSSDGITGETAEDTPRKETTDGYFGYFGEVSGEDNIINYIGDKSKINPTKFTTEGKFEYTENGELYVYYVDNGSSVRINKKVNDLTDDEHKTTYGSVLPVNKNDFLGKIGLKNIQRTTSDYSMFGDDGRVTQNIPYSVLSNDKVQFIKCYNKGNQLAYIAKYPVSSDIKYKDLRSLFLTGNGSRTFRHGKNIFKSRLLEYAATPVLDSTYPRKETNKMNITDDVTLYKNLFGNRLANYFQGDVGIAHDTDITYTNNGYIRTYKSGNSIKHIEGELLESQWGDVTTISETDNGNTTTTSVNGRLGHYRPLLEYVRESNIPFRLMKSYIPGPTKLKYDKATDTGYFGLMSSGEFISMNEILQMLNLTSDNLVTSEFGYFKFYYHGRILFIPTRPIVKINSDLDLEKIIRSGNFYGAKNKDDFYFFKNMRFSLSCLTYSDKDYSTTHNTYGEEVLGTDSKPLTLSHGGMFHQLLSRCFNMELLSNQSGYTGNHPFELWENNAGNLDLNLDLLTLDNVDGEVLCLDSNLALKKKSDATSELYYWPVISVEATDLNNQLTYGSWNVRPGKITYKTVKVTSKTLVPKTVTKTKPVIKYRTRYEDKSVVQIVKVPNDKLSFPKIPKNSKDKYGLIIFHALKTDPACDTRPLYARDRLNVRKHQSGYILGYSEEYASIDQYIAKSVLVTNNEGLCATPLHIAITFQEATTCRNYIRDLIREDIQLGVLKNYIPTIPYTDNNNKYPLGILYGCISSMISYFPVNPTYNLYNQLENIIGDMNLNPLIIDKNGRYLNTWTTMPDDNTTQTIPCLSGFLDYFSYTDEGRKILDNYAKFIAIKEGLPTGASQINNSVQEIIGKYNFGIVGVDLDTLHIMQDRNGILTGSYLDPVLRKLGTDYRLMNYFTTTTKNGYSSGNDFTDIMHPEQGYDNVETTITVQVPISVPYTEMVEYTETVYVEETIEEDILVPIYTYENI